MLNLLEGFFEEWDSGDSIRVVCGFIARSGWPRTDTMTLGYYRYRLSWFELSRDGDTY